jgi:hypothetical protein
LDISLPFCNKLLLGERAVSSPWPPLLYYWRILYRAKQEKKSQEEAEVGLTSERISGRIVLRNPLLKAIHQIDSQ